MEIYSIDTKEFRNILLTSVIVMILFIAGAWLWVYNGFISLPFFEPLRGFSSPILLAMMVLAIVYSSYRRKRLNALNTVDDFAVKVKDYVRIYKLHNGWFVLSCFVSCFLFIVTSRNFFLYFALLQLLITLTAYPSKSLFKRELKNEEVVIY